MSNAMIEQIDPAEFKSWLAARTTPVVVLDVREAWELQLASIQAQAIGLEFELITIPMNSIPSEMAALSESAKDKTIACLCHHGMRSQRVAQYLAQNGLGEIAAQIVNIAGGIAAWSHSVDPSVPQY